MILEAKKLKNPGRKYYWLTASDIGKIYMRKYLRLAPCFYFILFFGWNLSIYMSSAPLWPTINNFWFNCDVYWWHKVLFVGNITYFQEPTQGCMFWAWAIQCDMQLHLLIPFLVMIYSFGGQTMGNTCMWVLICFSMWLNCHIIGKYNLKTCIIALEDYALLDRYYSKPWTKLFAVGLGIYFANIYMNILAYRRV